MKTWDRWRERGLGREREVGTGGKEEMRELGTGGERKRDEGAGDW